MYIERRISTEIFNRIEKIVDEVSESFSPPREGGPLDNFGTYAYTARPLPVDIRPPPTVVLVVKSFVISLLPITVIMSSYAVFPLLSYT